MYSIFRSAIPCSMIFVNDKLIWSGHPIKLDSKIKYYLSQTKY